MPRASATAWKMCRPTTLGLLDQQRAVAENRSCAYPGHPVGRPLLAPTHVIPYSFDTRDGPFEVCSLCAEDYLRDGFSHQRTKDALAADEAGERADYDVPV